jgi:DNA-binding response OmpR family regulator
MDQSILNRTPHYEEIVSTMSKPTNLGTVVICDDEAHVRHIVAAKLREHGYAVVEARDGIQGFEMAVAERAVLVITDLQMPGGSGMDLAVALKAHESTSKTPVLMLTARGYVMGAPQLDKTNIKEVIAKPFGVRQLMERVHKLLAPSSNTGEERLAA